ncbi:centrosomal protein of 44 kDa-like [Centruroides sculpturatus]|uniref:centrosomal protein of 44 kDa-like n=1 Tax=Centruroides sculpturatus TaxID=218467 RepID=UPI000C6CED27|nr:centrosomal protein of 44 kDa-like [Centruroides sculpturatus]
MATGDLKNNLKKLNLELKKIRLPQHLFDFEGFASGDSDSYLPVYDYLFDWFSPPVMHMINDKGYKLPSYQQDKGKFMENFYLILREIFNWKPVLSITQFFSNGFIEHKVMMCSETVRRVREKHAELEAKTPERKLVTHSGIRMIFKNANNNTSKEGLIIKKEITSFPSDMVDTSSSSEDILIQDYEHNQLSEKMSQIYHKLFDTCEEVREMKHKFTSVENQLHELQQKINCLSLKLEQSQRNSIQNCNSRNSPPGRNSPSFRGN